MPSKSSLKVYVNWTDAKAPGSIFVIIFLRGRDPLAEKLTSNEAKIVEELNAVQGSACDINGYYFADEALAAAAMKPSATLNEALASLAVNA